MKKIRILLVEDDEDDQYIFAEALREIHFTGECIFAGDGIKALDLLNTADILPSIIIVDLNMPLINGIELLDKIKKDGRLENIPVIILTTSESVCDRKLAMQMGAELFISKTADFKQLKKVISEMLVLC